MRIGAHYLGNGTCEFVVWAPFLKSVAVKLISPDERLLPMKKDEKGYWKACVEDVYPGACYFYQLGEKTDRPDPASYFQPAGVHQYSQVVEFDSFKWKDSKWKGIELSQLIIYELHVGTFTPQGTFDAILPRLNSLKELGVNAIELMPVAQFPGERNWGYDGAYLFAVQNLYGGPEGLMRLVNECHKQGISVILDVVYNHLGPEGNYLAEYGPYFTDKYHTPWGKAINFDDAYSDEVRSFFLQNALFWFENYHIDALRLDAIHGIYDMGAKHILEELKEKTAELSVQKKKTYYLIAESNLNDTKITRTKETGGYGIDSQWCDDLHHSLHTLLTGEITGYYCDFGETKHLVKSLGEGFAYSGEYSPFRKRRHGNSSKNCPPSQFVVFSQNHDQIGNRMLGERLSTLVSFEALKLAAGVILLSPYIPLLFMGEEYGEEAPFLYFVSHSDVPLIEAVRRGRKHEFHDFQWQGEPPDPQDSETFLTSKLNWGKKRQGHHKVLLDFYKHLIHLRKTIPAFANQDKNKLSVYGLEDEKVVFLQRGEGVDNSFTVFNFSDSEVSVKLPLQENHWKKLVDSSDEMWDGPGSLLTEKTGQFNQITLRKHSFITFIKE
ncbi:malto-oligosyltrehalose trehalohydrolase [Candidatus Kuenenia stuttgartiensis]|uniref:Malto-oligosyltrehalose trehalohydrolase n=1 Tax=Kuenenia stuttgartiensis TaxID=174633 RepID=Q1Q1E0_KUEST|nr:malto-oligosyltrehalose trehalohydrolase [Candidatus Kuenenia stuttgartiensis]MCF6152024.1 malto-oligosyltrehalose trehalohydrolase [Candidatus Kuenenia stuttgartiensis]QII10847.1 malto-oligosyltrehalose trehalohydrolase [Candidatus Kuenenia stuttgartiensis]GJQ49001.1 MAG: malto-oligosyltrehalose trehalohydrolase [Candidatus Kuenenia stuttgartiensis]CAJ73818.1 strongly similar to malto-oligosyltrehalose trehalohydrolase [Candidatus Kuenenia stuttgartiensis]